MSNRETREQECMNALKRGDDRVKESPAEIFMAVLVCIVIVVAIGLMAVTS